MTFSIDGNDIGGIVAIVSVVGTIVSILVVSLFVYLLVRPPRHIRARRKAEKRGEIARRPELSRGEAEELMALVDRMEDRLAVLERAMGGDDAAPRRLGRDEDGIFEPVEDRESGRTK